MWHLHAARKMSDLLHQRTGTGDGGESRCAESWPARHHRRSHRAAVVAAWRAVRRAWHRPVHGAARAVRGQPRRLVRRRGVVDAVAATVPAGSDPGGFAVAAEVQARGIAATPGGWRQAVPPPSWPGLAPWVSG